MNPLAAGLTFISAFFHAGWNLIARKYRGGSIFVRVPLLISLAGLIPALLAGYLGSHFPPGVWVNFTFGGVCLAFYYLGLTQGYQSGDFSVVYPLARSLPVLVIAIVDISRGHPPSAAGWIGMILVMIGCMLSPLTSLREIKPSAYLNVTSIWIMITAAGMVGYTIVDSQAAERMTPGLAPLLRYQVFEVFVSFMVLWPLLLFFHQPLYLERDLGSWKWPAVMALLLFGGYGLVLLAYQLSPETSYVVAIRQFSIVIGVTIGAFYFKERAPVLRISAALIITAGVLCIALAG
jgi:drug/metabolite transporter (DMT)-like permease